MAEGFYRELIVSNETANLVNVRNFISENLCKTELCKSEHGKVILAVDEAVSNIMRHAYDNFSKGTRTIEIVFSYESGKITLILKDSGKEFNPTIIKDPDIMEHARLGKRYGLGLFMMRRIMDEVKFVFRAGIENMLTMVKYVHSRNDEEKKK